MKFRVYPYKQGSRSAKALAEALGGKVLKHVGSKFRPKQGDVVINWGAGNVPDFGPAQVLNKDVTVAQCKLASFEALEDSGVQIPRFTADREVAKGFNFPVVCRTVLRGHSGAGIVIANTPDELVAAPLYVEYKKKQDEYRVHIVAGEAFFVQRKARKLDNENPNWLVRNLAGGFSFVEVPVRKNFERHDHRWDCPGAVIDEAEDACQALDIEFGGVDVIWNQKEQKAYVLEANSACGLEERTAEKYAEAFRDCL